MVGNSDFRTWGKKTVWTKFTIVIISRPETKTDNSDHFANINFKVNEEVLESGAQSNIWVKIFWSSFEKFT